MATTIYLTNTTSDISIGGSEVLEARVGVRGAGLSSGTADTATFGVQLTRNTTSDVPIVWLTKPLDATTITAAAVTVNLWMSESNMSANVDAFIRVQRADGTTGAAISTILNVGKGTELPVTTRAAQNWAPTATNTSISAGERLLITIFGGSTLSQASGFTFDASWGATSSGADGDTFLTFTDTITEQAGAAAASNVILPVTRRSFGALIVR